MKPILYKTDSGKIVYQPYYVYDLVTVYNKTTNAYENRRRLTGISFFEKKIILSMALCSNLDVFSKEKARDVVARKLRSTITHLELGKPVTRSNIFHSIEEFNYFCDNMGKVAHLMFTPHNISATINKEHITINGNIKKKRTNAVYPSNEDNIASVYFHQDFVNSAWTLYMKTFEETPTSP